MVLDASGRILRATARSTHRCLRKDDRRAKGCKELHPQQVLLGFVGFYRVLLGFIGFLDVFGFA